MGLAEGIRLLSPEHAAASAIAYGVPLARRVTTHCDRDRPWKQTGSYAPVIDYAEEKEIVDRYGELSKAELDYYTTPRGVVDLNLEGIQQAVDLRMALIFMQFIVCYKMPFYFASQGADSQIGSASKLHLKEAGSKEWATHNREAAHPSTTPCLIAYSRAEWDAYQHNRLVDPRAVVPRSFVYLKGSYFYNQNNATIGMHRDVNGADELIDGKGNDGKLRDLTMRITNLVAQGTLDPVTATIEFIATFKYVCQAQIARFNAHDTRHHVIAQYLILINRVEVMAQRPEFFAQLLSVKIDPLNPKAPLLHEIVFQRRYAVIRLAATIESRIAKRILDAKALLPAAQQYLLEFALLQNTHGKERRIIEKLLAKTPAVLEDQYRLAMQQGLSRAEAEKIAKEIGRFQTAAKNFATRHVITIQNLMRDLRADFKEMFDAERTFRSGLFRDLRTDYHNWRQKDFVAVFKALFPGQAMSTSMVSRLEQRVRPITKVEYLSPLNQRRKDVTIDRAMMYAQTFGVDHGLLFSGVFGLED